VLHSLNKKSVTKTEEVSMAAENAQPLLKRGLWYKLNDPFPRTVWEGLKRMTGSGLVSTGTRSLAGDHVLWMATCLMAGGWLWSMATTTFRGEAGKEPAEQKRRFRWNIIEDIYVLPRVSFSVAITWWIRKDHTEYALQLLAFAVVGILLYFVLRRKQGLDKDHENTASVFFVIAMRIVGVSVAGPFYRWFLAGMNEFRNLCLLSSGIWGAFLLLSMIPSLRKKMPNGEREPIHKLIREAVAVPVHVAFGTPVVEWTVHGKGYVWGPLMGISVLFIIGYWMWYVKTEGWPSGSNRRDHEEISEELPEGP